MRKESFIYLFNLFVLIGSVIDVPASLIFAKHFTFKRYIRPNWQLHEIAVMQRLDGKTAIVQKNFFTGLLKNIFHFKFLLACCIWDTVGTGFCTILISHAHLL